MQFFRKIYKSSEQYVLEITEDLCNLGFVSGTDGSDFPSETFNERWLKWKGETLLTKDQYLLLRMIGPRTPAIHTGHMYVLGGSGVANFENTADPTCNSLFFIPLINNSFFLRLKRDITTTAIPYFPSLLDLVPGTPNSEGSFWTYIGLLTSNLTTYSPYSYFLYSGNGIQGSYSTYYNFVTGRNEQFLLEGLDTPYRYGNDSGRSDYKFWDLESVSVSAGTCILTKVPYQNAYIDGLYYIVVSPQESVDGKFFSFGGRNFLGAGRNLVVELLSN